MARAGERNQLALEGRSLSEESVAGLGLGLRLIGAPPRGNLGGGTTRAAAADAPIMELEEMTVDSDGVTTIYLPPCVASADIKTIISAPDQGTQGNNGGW